MLWFSLVLRKKMFLLSSYTQDHCARIALYCASEP